MPSLLLYSLDCGEYYSPTWQPFLLLNTIPLPHSCTISLGSDLCTEWFPSYPIGSKQSSFCPYLLNLSATLPFCLFSVSVIPTVLLYPVVKCFYRLGPMLSPLISH